MNLVEMLGEAAARYGDRPAIVHGEQNLSFSHLHSSSSAFAAALLGRGVKKGDRIALLLGNSIEFVIAYFGIVKTGAMAVLLDPKYKPAELISLFDDCRPRAVVCEIDSPEDALLKLKDTCGIEFLVNAGHHAQDKTISFSEFISVSTAEFKPASLYDSDPAHISYTSGPSFSPWGVVAPHGNLVDEIRISAASFEQSENDTVIQFALPMHHVIGLTVVMLTSVYCGSRLIILNGVSIDNLLAGLERHKITMFMGVPFIHSMVLRKIESEGLKHSLDSLRVCASAGDILPVETVQSYLKLLKLRLINFYGLTETLGHVTCEPLHGPSVQGSAGLPLAGWEIAIADKGGAELPPGHPGEVIIRGPMMSGYYRNPEATNQAVRNAWLHTGDRGEIDQDGFLHMLGLQKDMLICKGQNIFPSDIEHVLRQHESVAEAAVVGVPDRMRGETGGPVQRGGFAKILPRTAC
jgi:long-chain acyl-CoA synthetase